jgi:flagellar export protein FliJ
VSELQRAIRRVERLLQVRGFEEQKKRRDFAVALSFEASEDERLTSARAEAAAALDAQRTALLSGSIAAAKLLELNGAIEVAAEYVGRREVALERARLERVVKESEWRESRRRALSLEKLRDRRREELREERARLERKEFDEVALALHARGGVAPGTSDAAIRKAERNA